MSIGNLIYLEYNFNSNFADNDNGCRNINVSKERKTIVYNYGDETYKEYKINNSVFLELNKILSKYDILNWDKYDDMECIDGDNTFISYKYDNGEYGVISMEEYPVSLEGVFNEILTCLNKIKN